MATPAAPTLRPEGLAPGHPADPLLEPGDRLTREEFERRYERMPNVKKAELIEGIVSRLPHEHLRQNFVAPSLNSSITPNPQPFQLASISVD